MELRTSEDMPSVDPPHLRPQRSFLHEPGAFSDMAYSPFYSALSSSALSNSALSSSGPYSYYPPATTRSLHLRNDSFRRTRHTQTHHDHHDPPHNAWHCNRGIQQTICLPHRYPNPKTKARRDAHQDESRGVLPHRTHGCKGSF